MPRPIAFSGICVLPKPCQEVAQPPVGNEHSGFLPNSPIHLDPSDSHQFRVDLALPRIQRFESKFDLGESFEGDVDPVGRFEIVSELATTRDPLSLGRG